MENKQSIENILSKIEKEYGKKSLFRLIDVINLKMDIINTGSIGLDIALGTGGYPKGKIIEIFGPESSGKTTLSLHAIAECQSNNGVCVFIDVEHAFDKVYAKRIGINLNELIISQPDSGEQALEIIDLLTKSNSIDLIVVDSVAALVPKNEIISKIGDNFIGLHARLMSQAMRKLNLNISKSKTTLIFINQIRMKIGITFGNPETTPGGNALKFYSSIRIDIRKISCIKNNSVTIGNITRIKIIKNKFSSPFKIVEFNLIYGYGICKNTELIDLGMSTRIIKKSGLWYYYNSIILGKGKDDVKIFLNRKKNIFKEISNKIKEIEISKNNVV